MITESMLRRVAAVVLLVTVVTLATRACGGEADPALLGDDDAGSVPATVSIPVDDDGFPLEWPVALPPGSVSDCPNGQVSQLSQTFSIVSCVPDGDDPLAAAERYLAELAEQGFAEREPGSFALDQQTFLDGNGLEVYFQLMGSETTVVLVKPG